MNRGIPALIVGIHVVRPQLECRHRRHEGIEGPGARLHQSRAIRVVGSGTKPGAVHLAYVWRALHALTLRDRNDVTDLRVVHRQHGRDWQQAEAQHQSQDPKGTFGCHESAQYLYQGKGRLDPTSR